MDKSTTDQIVNTVNACPSGALSIKHARPPDLLCVEELTSNNKITIVANGPMKISGPVKIKMADGTIVEKPNGVSLCRCGQSKNKPFCDASHKTIGFVG